MPDPLRRSAGRTGQRVSGTARAVAAGAAVAALAVAAGVVWFAGPVGAQYGASPAAPPRLPAQPAGVLAQQGGSELEQAKQALRAAEERVNSVQRDLEAAQQRKELAAAQRQAATEQLNVAAEQEQQLSFSIGIRARSTYMKGSPVSVASVISNAENADALLDRVGTLEQLARHDSETIRDLQSVQQIADAAAADLAAAEESAARAQESLQVKLDEADELYEERLAVFNGLDQPVAQEAATELAAERSTQVSGGGSGTCDLSGVPPAAVEIIMRESGGRPTAQNPTSTAFGLGQLLIDNRIRLMGDNYASTDCGDQYAAFEAYTLGRYGSFEAALAHHNNIGWY